MSRVRVGRTYITVKELATSSLDELAKKYPGVANGNLKKEWEIHNPKAKKKKAVKPKKAENKTKDADA